MAVPVRPAGSGEAADGQADGVTGQVDEVDRVLALRRIGRAGAVLLDAAMGEAFGQPHLERGRRLVEVCRVKGFLRGHVRLLVIILRALLW